MQPQSTVYDAWSGALESGRMLTPRMAIDAVSIKTKVRRLMRAWMSSQSVQQKEPEVLNRLDTEQYYITVTAGRQFPGYRERKCAP